MGFPNQRALLTAAYPEIDQESLLPEDAPADPQARLELVLQGAVRIVLQWEHQLRASLRRSLEPGEDPTGPVLRRGRAVGWIAEALAPLAESAPQLDRHRLAVAIRAATGIEAFIWMVDVAGLSRDEAAQTMRWSGLALLRSALAEEPPLRSGR